MREIQGRTKQTHHVVDIPNLVELQLNSYKWFLENGLKELFDSFSPIYDFTGRTSISLTDFILGEPKYSLEECRDRDMTFESPIKAKVLLRSEREGIVEEIESEVYLGDLPLMTDKGTFIINGAERVVVSQLARSPGVYFEEWMDYSGKVLFRARLIPQEGAWMEVETNATHEMEVHLLGPGRKFFPLTTLLRALQEFPAANIPLKMRVGMALKQFELPVTKPDEAAANEQDETASSDEQDETFFYETRFAAPVVADKDVYDSSSKKRILLHARGEALYEEEAPATRDVLLKLQELFGEDFLVTLRSPMDTDEELAILFSKRVNADPSIPKYGEKLLGRRTADAILDPNGKVLLAAGKKIDKETAKKLEERRQEVVLLEVNPYVESTLAKDPSHTPDEALQEICRKLRPGDPATMEAARTLLKSLFYDMRRYDLARVGRYKVNLKLGFSDYESNERTKINNIDNADSLPDIGIDLKVRSLTREDLAGIIRYIIKLHAEQGTTDDIDHLENKRIRSVGELLISQLRMGFQRMEKVARERMTSSDANVLPQVILSVKPISASIKSFFGSSQLSQFMDQTNPLAELVAKRRLSALGPGGLSRQNAKLEVRDVHHSHYGRICPIETPEGPNIGLIGSMAVYARINNFGFLQTPYRIVKHGLVSNDLEWMTADKDHKHYIAPANLQLDKEAHFVDEMVQVRHEDGYPVVNRSTVEYMDIAPVQLISIATALIPFIENDEATRALMGANMQRQSVPTLRPSAPLVKTGMERRAARDSGSVLIAQRSGTVSRVTAESVEVTTSEGRIDRYSLINMFRSNNGTCITQKPIVHHRQHVRQGQVLTDGPCTQQGELALGQNLLVAFMPWGGYNYEDAILLSQRLVKDDVFTSIHVEESVMEARDTKLGPEEITRDIPNVGEDALKDLDADGIIRVGAEVRPEDILVGKVAPKGQGELTAEERLIIAIFGKKAEETRDVSLRVPHGNSGRIVDVKVFSRFKYKGSRDQRIYNFCKRPDPSMHDTEDGELLREPADELPAGVNMRVRVYIAQKRKIMEGDKMAGRHGNKGVISKILPEEDMPFLPDGTPVDIVLNPLGVPSRMNIGQILETHLGYVGHHLNCSFVNPAFEGMTEIEIIDQMQRLGAAFWKQRLELFVNSELGLNVALNETYEHRLNTSSSEEDHKILYDKYIKSLQEPVALALKELSPDELDRVGQIVAAPEGATCEEILERIVSNCSKRVGFDPNSGKTRLRNGLTGEMFDLPVTVGVIYMLKLAHLVDDKIHARSTGPYSLVTQQPLGGKAQFGGQRFGEMEVWALEAYGAAYTLQEILTIKSDDVLGRVKTYESIVKGDTILEPGVPESFKILVNELQSLGLKVTVLDQQDHEIDLRDTDDDIDPKEAPDKAAARRQQRNRPLPQEEESVL